MTASASPEVCPQCASPIPFPRPSLCPTCHYPLLFIEEEKREAVADGLLQTPSEPTAGDETVVGLPAPQLGPPEASAPTGTTVGRIPCPHCGFSNAPGRVWCEQCGRELAAALASAPPQPVPPEPQERRPRPRWWLPVALVLAVGLGVGAWYVSGQLGRVSPTTQPSAATPTPTPTATPTQVARANITAKASSTLPGATTLYDPEQTIDGDPATAWQSHGKRIGATAHVTLQWDFQTPVRLASINVHNGYQRAEGNFYNNGRLKNVVITTQSGTFPVELADVMGVQTLRYEFGVTTYVKFDVETVYRSRAIYPDLALSEISFLGTAP